MSASDRAPLEAAEIVARRIAQSIGGVMPEGWGFALWLVQYGPEGQATYLSSIERESAIRFLEEWIEHQKALPATGGFVDRTAPECWCCGGKQALITLRGSLRAVQVCSTCVLTEGNANG